MRVLHRVRPYEMISGSANQLYDKWQKFCTNELLKPSVTGCRAFYRNCRDIIREFDRLPLTDQPSKPKVGIVGEVLVKYMPLANNHLIGLLEEEGAEVVVPDFMDFLEFCFWNAVYRKKHLGGSRLAAVIANAAAFIMDASRKPVYRTMKHSDRFREGASFKEIRRNAQQILSLGNQVNRIKLMMEVAKNRSHIE